MLYFRPFRPLGPSRPLQNIPLAVLALIHSVKGGTYVMTLGSRTPDHEALNLIKNLSLNFTVMCRIAAHVIRLNTNQLIEP